MSETQRATERNTGLFSQDNFSNSNLESMRVLQYSISELRQRNSEEKGVLQKRVQRLQNILPQQLQNMSRPQKRQLLQLLRQENTLLSESIQQLDTDTYNSQQTLQRDVIDQQKEESFARNCLRELHQQIKIVNEQVLEKEITIQRKEKYHQHRLLTNADGTEHEHLPNRSEQNEQLIFHDILPPNMNTVNFFESLKENEEQISKNLQEQVMLHQKCQQLNEENKTDILSDDDVPREPTDFQKILQAGNARREVQQVQHQGANEGTTSQFQRSTIMTTQQYRLEKQLRLAQNQLFLQMSCNVLRQREILRIQSYNESLARSNKKLINTNSLLSQQILNLNKNYILLKPYFKRYQSLLQDRSQAQLLYCMRQCEETKFQQDARFENTHDFDENLEGRKDVTLYVTQQSKGLLSQPQLAQEDLLSDVYNSVEEDQLQQMQSQKKRENDQRKKNLQKSVKIISQNESEQNKLPELYDLRTVMKYWKKAKQGLIITKGVPEVHKNIIRVGRSLSDTTVSHTPNAVYFREKKRLRQKRTILKYPYEDYLLSYSVNNQLEQQAGGVDNMSSSAKNGSLVRTSVSYVQNRQQQQQQQQTSIALNQNQQSPVQANEISVLIFDDLQSSYQPAFIVPPSNLTPHSGNNLQLPVQGVCQSAIKYTQPDPPFIAVSQQEIRHSSNNFSAVINFQETGKQQQQNKPLDYNNKNNSRPTNNNNSNPLPPSKRIHNKI